MPLPRCSSHPGPSHLSTRRVVSLPPGSGLGKATSAVRQKNLDGPFSSAARYRAVIRRLRIAWCGANCARHYSGVVSKTRSIGFFVSKARRNEERIASRERWLVALGETTPACLTSAFSPTRVSRAGQSQCASSGRRHPPQQCH